MLRITAPAIALSLALSAGTTAMAQDRQMEFITNWDVDGNGTVSVEDIASKRGDLFTMFDENADGWLEGAEWQTFAAFQADQHDVKMEEGKGQGMAGHGQGSGTGKGHGQGMGQMAGGQGPGAVIHPTMTLEGTDADGDGKTSRSEFVDIAPQLFAAMDRSGDGVIDSADFGKM